MLQEISVDASAGKQASAAAVIKQVVTATYSLRCHKKR